MRLIRQGDVLLLEVLKLPSACQEIGAGRRLTLAYGEATGHAHELVVADTDCGTNEVAARLYGMAGLPESRRFLFVDRACVLTHQEHGAISIRPGFYEVIQQREYVPPLVPNSAQNSRYVVD
jgi:hypothetical protein